MDSCPRFHKISLQYKNHDFDAEYGFVQRGKIMFSFPVQKNDDVAQQLCQELTGARGTTITLVVNNLPLIVEVTGYSFSCERGETQYRDFSISIENQFKFLLQD